LITIVAERIGYSEEVYVTDPILDIPGESASENEY
jgi:hypothetical protein